MLSYRDFVPKKAKAKWYEGETYETFDAAVTAANAWVKEASVKIVNIETVVLPNIYSPEEAGAADAGISTISGWATWHQFVRVWHETP